MGKARTVQGEIVLPMGEGVSGPANLVVTVEDVSKADAPSVVIGEHRLKQVSLSPGKRVPFVIQIPAELVEERHLYSIRAHVDRSGSGEVKKEDFISTETYPVLGRGYGTSAIIKVRRV